MKAWLAGHLDGLTTELTTDSVAGRPFRTVFIRSHGEAVVIAISELEDQAPPDELAKCLPAQTKVPGQALSRLR